METRTWRQIWNMIPDLLKTANNNCDPTSGTYSKVYKGKWRRSKNDTVLCAIKIIDEKTAPSDFIQNFMPREIEISKQIQHKNLLTTLKHFSFMEKTYIITELANFDLLQYLRLKGMLNKDRKWHENRFSITENFAFIDLISFIVCHMLYVKFFLRVVAKPHFRQCHWLAILYFR